MGGFNDQASLKRIIYSVVHRFNAQWKKREHRPLQRRFSKKLLTVPQDANVLAIRQWSQLE